MITSTGPTIRRHVSLPRPRPSAIALGASYGAVIALAAFGAPRWLALPATAVLLLVPGAALWRLLTGDRRGDPAARIPLTALLGILLWLAVALLLNVIGVPLNATALALAVGGLGACLVLLAGMRRFAVPETDMTAESTHRTFHRLRGITTIASTAAVMLGAAWLATSMPVTPVERYTTLGFVDNKPFTSDVPAIRWREPVRLNWELRGFGCDPSPTLTRVGLTIDGRVMDDFAVDVSSRGDRTLSGAVTFITPNLMGRHLVELTVLPTAQDGTSLPAPGYVSTPVEVRK
jgi:hypothetical protein